MTRIIKAFWLVMLFAFALGRQSASAQLDGSGIAPDFTLTDIDGNTHHLYDYLDQGKVVILDFYTVWCTVCQTDASYLEEVYQEYGPAGSNKIVMLSLEADETISDQQVRDYVKDFNVSNPNINATEQVPDDYNVNFFPTYYVVAPDRSYILIGGRQESMKELMIEAINKAPELRTVENDIRVMTYSKPKGSMCVREVFPEIRIQNYGKNTVTSLQVETLVDGVVKTLYPYFDSIEPYHFADLQLPWLIELSKGWHTIEFKFPMVNNLSDGDPDDGISGGDFLILPDGDHVTVSLTTDSYPKESNWKIFDGQKVVASVSGYTRGLTTESHDVCVDAGTCYQLVLYDSFGDGMSSGGLEISYNNEVIASVDAESFNADSVLLNFCVRSNSTGISFKKSGGICSGIYPNPSSGEFILEMQNPLQKELYVEVLNVLGETLISTKMNQGAINMHIDLSNSPAGLYFVRLTSEELIRTHRIILNH